MLRGESWSCWGNLHQYCSAESEDRGVFRIITLEILTYLRRSNLSWSASLRRPRGSQNPKGACAPRASENCIFMEDDDTLEAGATKAEAVDACCERGFVGVS